MANIIRKVLALLSPQERRRAYLLLGMILIMALLDVVGIASIMPFMAVLANPEVVGTNAYLNTVYTALGFSAPQEFLFFLGLMVFMAMVVSIGFKALTIFALTRFTLMRNYSIGRRLVAAYLRQPYEWFLNRHSADLGKNILTEVQLVIVGAVMPLMHLLAQGALVLAILVLLLWVNPLLAIAVGVGLGMSYGLIYLALRRVLARAGAKRVEANEDRFKVLSEAFGGIKEVKVRNLETTFIERFDPPAAQFSKMQVINTVAGALPRYALEILAFGGMLLLMLNA